MHTTDISHIKSAKKDHDCDWCGELICKGSPYSRYRWYEGGDAGTVKMHPECEKASEELSIELGEEIHFYPGENPRGCNCNFDRDCEKCKSTISAEVEI